MPPCPAKFVFLVEMGFLHVGQAGLELLTSGDPPASAFPKYWDYGHEPLHPAHRILLSFILYSQLPSLTMGKLAPILHNIFNIFLFAPL